MTQIKEEIELQITPRKTEGLMLQIPMEALRSLEQVAKSRDMSVEALLKFYSGHGLRLDIAKLT